MAGDPGVCLSTCSPVSFDAVTANVHITRCAMDLSRASSVSPLIQIGTAGTDHLLAYARLPVLSVDAVNRLSCR